MADALQSRLDAVFGSLTPQGTAQEAWKPSKQQIFRGRGAELPPEDSDDEWEEQKRREALPGLAQALAAEDEADEEGFHPSTAFCRALDKEADYDDVDEAAVGLWARQRGEAEGEAMPPRSTEVLDDNPWEQRVTQAEALGRPAPIIAEAVEDARPVHASRQQQGEAELAGMEVEEAAEAAMATSPSAAMPLSPRSALADSSRPRLGQRKKVSFKGVAEPWVPPHRRQGYVPRDTGEAGGGGSDAGSAAAAPSSTCSSRVPDHVRNPHKYTVYELDTPLVVGGGDRQLHEEESAADLEHAAHAAAAAARQAQPQTEAAEEEVERWQGQVGGGIQFRARARVSGEGGAAGGGKEAGAAPSAGAVAVGVQLGADEEQGEGVGDGDAALQQAAPSGQQRKQRSLRSRQTVAADMED